ncbi:hypothetical protein RQP46_003373 [Phenoliferia psychrophenolica]
MSLDVKEYLGNRVLEACPDLVTFTCDAGVPGYRWCMNERVKGLQHLTLTHPSWYHLALPLPFHLASLEIHPCECWSQAFVPVLLNSSIDTITTLYLRDSFDAAALHLAAYFENSPPTRLRTLVIYQLKGVGYPRLISSLPVISTLEIELFSKPSIAAIESCKTPNLETLSFGWPFPGRKIGDAEIYEILRVIGLKSL